jgi:hypothetical protein
MNKKYTLTNGVLKVGVRRKAHFYSPHLEVIEVTRDEDRNVVAHNEFTDYSRSWIKRDTLRFAQYWAEQALASLPRDMRTAKQVQGAIINLQGKEWFPLTTIGEDNPHLRELYQFGCSPDGSPDYQPDEDNQHLRELQEQGLNGYEKGVLDV